MDYSFLEKYYELSQPLEYVSYTQMFGENATGFYAKLGMDGHNGIDYRASIGAPCMAMIDGTITVVREDSGGGRELRMVTDPVTVDGMKWRLEFVYYHLSSWDASEGSHVAKGQVIAYTGNTGKYTTGPHLHLGMKPQWYENDTWNKEYDNGYFGAIDPLPFIKEEDMEIENPYNLLENSLIQLTEGIGGFGLYTEGKLYVDDTDKILASFIVRNNGVIDFKATGVAQVVWDAYPHFDLKNKPL